MVPIIVIEPDLETRAQLITKILEESGLRQNHPNMFWLGEGEKLGIEQSRQIVEHLSLRPYQSGGQAVVILEADNLTAEAQSALLKALEEPPVDSVILLGAASEDNFLPTVLSRCQIISNKANVTSNKLGDKETIEKLIDSSIEERFKYLEKLEDKQKLLDDLTTYYRQQLTVNHTPLTINLLEDLIQAHRLVKQNVNLRATLEYLMLKLSGK